MTFEEWYYKTFTIGADDGCSPIYIARLAWRAAKEDSKSAVNLEYVPYYYGGINFSFWRVVGEDFTKTDNFKTKEQAKEWALQNGYSVGD